MKKHFLVALALGAALLTACGNNNEFTLKEVSEVSGAAAQEVKTIEEVVETEFPITTQVDETMEAGSHEIVQQGERGQSKITYEVTYENGKEISRKAISEEVIKEPVEAIVKVGPSDTYTGNEPREIIGYSEPTTANAQSTPRPQNTRTNSNVVREILSNPGALEKPSSGTTRPSTKPTTPSSPSSSQAPASSASSASTATPSTPEEPIVSLPEEDPAGSETPAQPPASESTEPVTPPGSGYEIPDSPVDPVVDEPVDPVEPQTPDNSGNFYVDDLTE